MRNQRRILLFFAATLVTVFLLSFVAPDKTRLQGIVISAELGDEPVYWDEDGPVASQLKTAEARCSGLSTRLSNAGPACTEATKATPKTCPKKITSIRCGPSAKGDAVELLIEWAPKPTEEVTPPTKHSASPPTWISLVPPALAVVWAFILGNALLALFLGVLGGCFILSGYSPIGALQIAFSDQIGATLQDPFNQKILIFTSSLVGLVHVCVASGGIPAFVGWLSRKSQSRRKTQATTVALGTAIFFDDYANTMVVGSSMRPLADRTQTSREKLAYLVDATSAPIAGVAFVSTWIGYEIGLFQSFGEEKLQQMFGPEVNNGFSVFLHSMPYRFYCILTLGFVIMLVWSRRDFGPMLRAERRVKNAAPGSEPGSRDAEDLPPKARPIDGVAPILLTLLGIVGAFTWLALTAPAGDPKNPMPATLRAIQSASDHMMDVLAWAGVLGSVVSIVWAFSRTTMTVRSSLGAYVKGLKILAPTLGILILAITMRSLTDALGTGTFLAALLHNIPAEALPMAVFVLSGVVAFSTGSSWATMGLLIPVALPMAHVFMVTHGAPAWVPLATAASVLDGAIFGDHCSPISDTTVMSSAATGCDHIKHVRTQLPYALTVMVVAMGCGYGISAITTGGPFLGYALGLAMLAIIIRVVGKHP